MKETWFTNRDGEYVYYDVPDDVADHIDDIWELVKFDINALPLVDTIARKIMINALRFIAEKLEMIDDNTWVMREPEWLNISYPIPEFLQRLDFIYWIWKRIMCRHGYHLFDEVINSDCEHYLVCDACELMLHIVKANKDYVEGD